MDDAKLLDKIQGCLMGVLIGDAMGMPWENLTAEEIKFKTLNQGVKDFCSAFSRTDSGADLKAGDTTDDWALTYACAASMCRRRGFDPHDLALAHITELERSLAGWGKTTEQGVRQLQEYFLTQGKSGRSPLDPPLSLPGRGSGNGVAMKVAGVVCPMAAFTDPRVMDEQLLFSTGITLDNLRENVLALGRLTHSDVQASAAAYGVAQIILDCLFDHPRAVEGTRENAAFFHVFKIFNSTELLGKETLPGSKFSRRVQLLIDHNLLFGSIDGLITQINNRSHCLESVPFAIAVFLRHSTNFEGGILEAVNAGGDTDTVAAMVGSMIGARVGLSGIPERFRKYSAEFDRALTLGSRIMRQGQLLRRNPLEHTL